MNPIGLYLHVPFCASRCPYCDFYTMRAGDNEKEEYLKAVRQALDRFAPRRVDSIYVGGGTPSVLPGKSLADLLDFIQNRYDVSDDSEITVECNPSSDLEHFLPEVTAAGVNRISMGMQSAVDAERRQLGRLADSRRVEEALTLCRRNGVDNVSLDLMLGVPGQTPDSLQRSLDFCIGHDVPHVSAYLLKIEEGTVFARRRDKLDLPDEDTVCDLYRQTGDVLGAAGLPQYEISNFARPGQESRHNLKYWRCEEYLGVGPSAHSYLDGQRFHYAPDLDAFLHGTEPVSDGPGGSTGEQLMLRLRLAEGVPTADLPPQVLDRAANPSLAPYLARDDATLRLTREGFLVSNAILAELLQDLEF